MASNQTRRLFLASLGTFACSRPSEAILGAAGARARSHGDRAGLTPFRSVQTREGRGALVRRLFPTTELPSLDPFVLLDDFAVEQPAGFPTHPHRGFEALTYMLDGAFHHTDHLGNDSVITAGGTQRFTSGRGAWHSEMPPPTGPNRGLQLWVNLPRRLKTMAPNYEGIEASRMPVGRGVGRTTRTVVGHGSNVELQTPMRYVDHAIAGGQIVDDEFFTGWTSLIYVLQGRVRANETRIDAYSGCVATSGRIRVVAECEARVVLLTGRPHHERFILRGPFVDA